MSPTSALTRCLGEKYRSFAGRASRSEFWWFSLVTWLVCGWLLHTFPFASLSASVSIVAVLAFAPPWLAVTARRLHDVGRSGWWQAPALALLVLAGLLAREGGITLALGLGLALLVAGFGAWVLSRPGTDGPNRFGPDPLTDPLLVS
ncbi:MAG: DUF805 domain-containing protein [Desulfovibrionaceae bacterium]|nr:DUF805 domain-containing protein [Desulfovibrionaceae bacterium]